MKQKQYYNLRQQHGHGEGSEAIHKTRNPHVISRLTGNPGNKDFNTFWMPDRVGHDSGVVSQSGRSMVEMLGTLAIMGVLSAGAIGGYSYAMNKHRTNELIYEATKRAQWVGTQLELGSEPSLGTFGTETFGFGSFSGIDNNLPNANQFGIQVSDLKKGVCDNLVNHLERTGVIRDVTNVDCQAGTATLVFNRDLSTSDSEVPSVESEVSGEVSAQASTEAPTTQDPDEVHCSGNGSWNGSSCYCDPDWDGEDCSEDHTCSGHGTWHQSWNNGAGGCGCEIGWGGSDCSKCSGHGGWWQSLNSGAGGPHESLFLWTSFFYLQNGGPMSCTPGLLGSAQVLMDSGSIRE